MTSWDELLDEMEELLRAQRSAAERGTPPPPSFVPPVGLGPLPDALRSRAEAVLAATNRLHDQLAAQRDEVARAIELIGNSMSRIDRIRRPPSAYIDTLA